MRPMKTYKDLAKAGMSARELEAAALLNAAAHLTRALEPDGNGHLADALAFNQRLWAHFAASIDEAGERLPDALRANILTLAGFVFGKTIECTDANCAVILPGLIKINRDLAAGLRAA